MILECGHEPSDDTRGLCGYGYDEKKKNRYCYACCLERDLTSMKTEQTWFGYLSSDGKLITNWPGGILAKVTYEKPGKSGFGRRSVSWRATAADGSRWYGRCSGRCMYTVMRRAK